MPRFKDFTNQQFLTKYFFERKKLQKINYYTLMHDLLNNTPETFRSKNIHTKYNTLCILAKLDC